MMPALFIGHGSPMNMVADNGFTQSLAKLGRELPRPAAIMVISAHWLTRGTFVDCSEKPGMIYDFGGFPAELYRIVYDCKGSPEYAEKAIDTSGHRGIINCNDTWGLDHASYSVLRHMYPEADIPVFEMSLDYTFNSWSPKPVRYHYELGRDLARLRESGVLVIGSGNIVHNLSLIDFSSENAPPYGWASEIDEIFKLRLLDDDHDALIDYRGLGKPACMAVPTLDHYLPMIYVLAMKQKNENIRFTYEGFQNASISMRCFQIG